ncbi:hypothetical protein C8Q77DRAFT_1067239 [Trametes polyzona]|nr:hypothetical protein C8Q77DRAFT_1067239 [Trametes polyzona]
MHAPLYLRLLSFIRALLGLPPMISPLAQAFGVTNSGDSSIGVSVALKIISPGCDRTLARARISRIRLKKGRPTGLAEHEYLLIDVNDGAESNPAFLGSVVVDRSFKQDSGTIKLAGSKDNVDAIDRIEFAPPTNNDLTVVDVTFRNLSECPLFSTLIIAADVLHTQSPSYILLHRQCYWFAGMLLRVLLGNADPTVTRDAELENFEYAYEGHPGGYAQPGRAGTFKHFFTLVTSKSIDELYQSDIRPAFETRKAEVEQEIENRWAEPQWAELAEQQVARKDAALEEMLREMAHKDEETARELARKDEELERMRQALARLQGPSGQE